MYGSVNVSVCNCFSNNIPYMYMPLSSTVEEAVETSHNALFFNHGQTCTAGSRTYVAEKIYDRFVEASAERANRRTVGDPFDINNEMGPQVKPLIQVLLMA